MGLTEDAKKELKEAIAIVREDRMDKFIRSRMAPKDDPPSDPPPTNDPPNPPPPKDDPPNDPPPNPTRKSSYWGELLDE